MESEPGCPSARSINIFSPVFMNLSACCTEINMRIFPIFISKNRHFIPQYLAKFPAPKLRLESNTSIFLSLSMQIRSGTFVYIQFESGFLCAVGLPPAMQTWSLCCYQLSCISMVRVSEECIARTLLDLQPLYPSASNKTLASRSKYDRVFLVEEFSTVACVYVRT